MIQTYYCADCNITGNTSSCPICGKKSLRIENQEIIDAILSAEFFADPIHIAEIEYLITRNARYEFNLRYLDLLFRMKSSVSRIYFPRFDETIEKIKVENLTPLQLHKKLDADQFQALNQLIQNTRSEYETLVEKSGLDMEIFRIQKLSLLQSLLNTLNMHSKLSIGEFNYTVKEEKKIRLKGQIQKFTSWRNKK